MPVMINYYDILGISRDATSAEIQEAYAFQIKVFHPDKYDPAAHPREHARALKMTQRLNEARDTLLDPEARRVYDSFLAGGSTGPVFEPAARRLPALTPHQVRWTLIAIMLGAFIVSSASVLRRLDLSPHPRVAGAAVTPTPSPCPTGEPTVTITSVDIRPNPDASPTDSLPSRLYVISGILQNPTTSEIATDYMGFYLGTQDPDLPPSWTSALSSMETEGGPEAIPAKGSITWKEKHIVEQPEPFPANVIPTLTFPSSAESRSERQWHWTNADPSCR